jgi:hypothetical protein
VAFVPKPIDTSKVVLPCYLSELTEMLAKNTHDLWARKRMQEGWHYGPHRDDMRKTHPNLVPYSRLSNSEKELDRLTATEVLKVITALDYLILSNRFSSKAPRKARRKTRTRPKTL